MCFVEHAIPRGGRERGGDLSIYFKIVPYVPQHIIIIKQQRKDSRQLCTVVCVNLLAAALS